jgi:hypothetical protein
MNKYTAMIQISFNILITHDLDDRYYNLKKLTRKEETCLEPESHTFVINSTEKVLHFAALIISQFLAVISIMAYLKCRTSRIFFMMLGFITLVIAEYVYLMNSTENIHVMFIPQVNIEISHLILLVMIIFFGISFLKSPQVKQV